MTFTNDDLVALRRQLAGSHYSIGVQTVRALMARLDAAEKVLDADECGCQFCDRHSDAILDWRRVKGE